MALAIAILFGAAGRMDIPSFWLYWAMFVTFVGGVFFIILRKDPDLMRERFRRGAGDADRVSRPVFGVMFLSHWILAGLDVGRNHWSDSVPWAAQAAGFVLLALGLAGWAWPMSVNRFFSAQVRYQPERGHRVIDRGPYAIVRHPGYVALLLLQVASPLALGSYLSAIPTAIMALFVLLRVRLEDRFLHANLPGYAEYASRVGYRLLPGIW